MELHNGQLYWKTTLQSQTETIKREIATQYDAIIIGGGMSGILTAYALAEEDLTVAVIDQAEMAGGSTAANTGLLQYSNDIMLHELIEQIGEVKAVRFYKLCVEALDQLEIASEKAPFSTDFKRRDSLYFASDESEDKKLKKEYDTLSKHGFDVEYWNRDKIEESFPFSKSSAIVTKKDAEVNPYRFCRGVIQYLDKKDVHFFEHVQVGNIQEIPTGIEVETAIGKFTAKQIIFTTGYAEIPFLPHNKKDLNRTYAIATEPITDLSDWHEQMMLWETKRPYLYARTTVDNRIIIGGLDEDKSTVPHNQELLEQRGERLEKALQDLFPTLDIKRAYTWAAVFGESTDNLPMIGEHPSKPNIYYLIGLGGNGTVYSMLGAKILSDLITGKENPDANIVKINR